MIIELSGDEKEFIIKLLQKTTVQRILDHLQSSSTVHPDHKDFIQLLRKTSSFRTRMKGAPEFISCKS
jgi:hypothetical protein